MNYPELQKMEQEAIADPSKYKDLLAARREAYMSHVRSMTISPAMKTWAGTMQGVYEAQAPGVRIKVWNQVLPNVLSSWLVALMIVRYGENIEHWPDHFTQDDYRRAQDWSQGNKPRGVRMLMAEEPDDAPVDGMIGRLLAIVVLVLGYLLLGLDWGWLSLFPALASALTDWGEDQMVTHLFRTGLTTTPSWAASTAYSVGDIVRPTTWNDRLFECVVAGTSGASEPAWDTTLGNETTDGTVTWQAIAVGVPKRAFYVALYTAMPGETGGGTEVTGGSYARAKTIPLDANWTATSGGNGLTDNAVDITFPAPTASWGTVVGMAFLTRSSGGNMFLYGALTTNRTVDAGAPAPKFAIGDLDVTWA